MTDASTMDLLRGSIGKTLDRVARNFLRRGIEDARIDAEVLICDVLGWDRARLYSRRDEPLPSTARGRFASLVRRRLRRVPVAYLTQERGFRNLSLRVGPGCLIPRPETELLVEVALTHLGDADPDARILDLGCGSGNISLAIVDETKRVRVTGVDCSRDALRFAKTNGAAAGLAARVSWVEGDIRSAAAMFRSGSFYGVVSNPPYVLPEDSSLAPELAYEPSLALFGRGEAFPAIYESIAGSAASLLSDGGFVAVEMGAGQLDVVRDCFRRYFARVTWHADLAGIPRVVVASERERRPLGVAR